MNKQAPLVVTIAWLAILFASNVSVIVWRVALNREVPGWDPVLRLTILAAMLGLCRLLPAIRPLCGFILALTALLLGNRIGTLFQETPGYVNWMNEAPADRQLMADTFVKLLPAALVGLTVSGTRRSDFFLVKGDLRAHSKTAALGHLRWDLLGPISMALFTLPLLWVLSVQVRPDVHLFVRALATLPLALIFAAINAASEEFRFRAVLLGRAVSAVGERHAVCLTAALFGIGHWFGHPSGVVGVVMTGIGGLILAQSMLDTRGFAWAWLIHAVQDIFVYASVAMVPPGT